MLEDKIMNDYKQAMKDKDTLKSSALSFLRAQIKNAAIESKKDKLQDAEVIAIIKKQIKQRQDSIEQFEKGGRSDLAEKEKKELGVLKSYLPQEMSAEQIAAAVEAAIKEAGAAGIKDMGQVMKAVLAKTAGQADNKLVSQTVKDKLSQL